MRTLELIFHSKRLIGTTDAERCFRQIELIRHSRFHATDLKGSRETPRPIAEAIKALALLYEGLNMTTAVCDIEVLNSGMAAQNETSESEIKLSDAEILRRVQNIRSTWTLAERRKRREEADRRFENLIETIFAEAA